MMTQIIHWINTSHTACNHRGTQCSNRARHWFGLSGYEGPRPLSKQGRTCDGHVKIPRFMRVNKWTYASLKWSKPIAIWWGFTAQCWKRHVDQEQLEKQPHMSRRRRIARFHQWQRLQWVIFIFCSSPHWTKLSDTKELFGQGQDHLTGGRGLCWKVLVSLTSMKISNESCNVCVYVWWASMATSPTEHHHEAGNYSRKKGCSDAMETSYKQQL